MHDPKKSAARP